MWQYKPSQCTVLDKVQNHFFANAGFARTRTLYQPASQNNSDPPKEGGGT
jgi:hypothetical protein